MSYGIPGVVVDGNDLLAVWAAAGEAVGRARSGGGPTLIEARTYRTAGHHEDESAGGVHRTQQQLDAWNQRCPILRFRKSLLDDGHASEPQVAEIESWMVTQMQEAVAFAEASPLPESASANENAWADAMGSVAELSPRTTKLIELSWLEAVRDGIAEAMRRDPHLIYFGEGVGEGEGHFGHTTGLWKEFGGRRVIDSPNCSVGLAGASVGHERKPFCMEFNSRV